MTLWIGILLAICVMAVLFLTVWRRRIHMADFGTMSAQWISEHRDYDLS